MCRKNNSKSYAKSCYTVNIIIADNGRTITKEEGQILFAPFAKGDEAHSGGKGTGLGLAISNLVVEKHGGRLYIDDSIQGYTKGFVICLKRGWAYMKGFRFFYPEICDFVGITVQNSFFYPKDIK